MREKLGRPGALKRASGDLEDRLRLDDGEVLGEGVEREAPRMAVEGDQRQVSQNQPNNRMECDEVWRADAPYLASHA